MRKLCAFRYCAGLCALGAVLGWGARYVDGLQGGLMEDGPLWIPYYLAWRGYVSLLAGTTLWAVWLGWRRPVEVGWGAFAGLATAHTILAFSSCQFGPRT